MRIKICCIQSVDEADMAVRAGADLIGLVAAMPSGPGPIDDAEIAKITRWTPPGVTSVLLSSETSAAGLIAHVRACRPSALQIVDAPSYGARMAVREAFPALKIIQVIHVEDRRALRDAEEATRAADAILLDSGAPSAARRELGGTGRVHDWSVSAEIVRTSSKPVFLAGGLTPENVGEAIAEVRPYGVDICSGLRTDDRLDARKLSRFVSAIRDQVAETA